MVRGDGRRPDQIRPVRFTPGFIPHAEGSVLIEIGRTRVICTATVEESVPGFMRGSGRGWITSEYAMLPRATGSRTQREASLGRRSGRTHEIQRLIGRSLRTAVDLDCLGERSIWVDCDVIEADGGTRTASITGAFVAVCQALGKLVDQKKLDAVPLRSRVAAISVGLIDGTALLDLNYQEDSRAEVDFNLVMTDLGEFVEIQGTAERRPFPRNLLDDMLRLGESGIGQLVRAQQRALDESAGT
jgi:ribonuclease PH